MKRLLFRTSLLTLAAGFGLALTALAADAGSDDLARAFLKPPDDARAWVYYFVMDGTFSRAGITPDLEAMKRAGIGGLIFMEAADGLPRGPVDFMSAEWKGTFKHLVEEAERLGLQVTLNAGPGWTGSGGPWVKPEQSMQHLVSSATDASGPAKFEGVLPQPAPRQPFFGVAGIPKETLAAQRAFYRDECVLAFPKAAAPAPLPDADEKALFIRPPYSSRSKVVPSLPAPADFPVTPEGAAIPRAGIIDLSSLLQPDGHLTWEVPAGEWTIMRFGRTSTGANTRPAPVAGLGLESDKFDPAALDAHFQSFVVPLLETIGPRPANRTTGWTMLHIDSWEMGAQNWTVGFREEFQRRRGYDPRPYLPALAGRLVESREVTERFLWDLRLTAQEMVLQNHAQHLKDLGRRQGFGLSIEPYDLNPTADLALGAVADVPMCEFWAEGDGFNTAYTCLESTSVAHLRGRPIVGAEAFTGSGRTSWVRHPGTMKNQADWAFAIGINRLTFHRYAHQSWPGAAPGMTMGRHGTQYERTQTWWELSGSWHDYLSRCQHLLRQGHSVADVLYLTPEGAPQVFRPPPSALAGSNTLPDRRGYNFDGCDPGTLLDLVRVRDGRLVLPSGGEYRLLVLPEVETMTPALLGKVHSLLREGATIMGPRPRKSPSLVGFPPCDAEVQRLAEQLWGSHPAGQPVAVAQGKLIPTGFTGDAQDPFRVLYPAYDDTAKVLSAAGVAPDFEADQPMRFHHRRVGAGDVYFVSNPADKATEAICQFRVAGKQPELWDPVTGQRRPLPDFAFTADGRTSIPLQFEPWESYFVVFQQAGAPPKERPHPANFPLLQPVAEISGPWEVKFPLAEQKTVTLDPLTSWSEHADPEIKYFSGTATYRRDFEIKPELLGGGLPLLLDLGDVQVMAEVRLNDQLLGTLWHQPYRIDITQAARPGANRLEIRVVNLWPNRLIGDAAIPADTPRNANGMATAWPSWLKEGLASPTGRHAFAAFDPFKKESPLLPSGLLGPVRLLTATPPAQR